MPLQNRVTPFGTLVAVPERGLLFGNRGVLHDAERRIVRHHQGRRWIACLLDFRGRHREIMPPGRYTGLFFLDEATALAAGHRPCAECRRPDYEHFRRCWAGALGYLPGILPAAAEMDVVLHRDRLAAPWTKRTHRADVAALPDGVFLLHQGEAWLLRGAALLRWAPGGYERRVARPDGGEVTVLTPAAIVRTIAAGYAPTLHPSALPAAPAVG